MVVGPLWRGPGNIHGHILELKSNRQGKVTAQTPTVPAVSGVRITTLTLCTCNLTTIACGSPDLGSCGSLKDFIGKPQDA